MYVNTTEAASLLEISPSRLRQLLQQRRVKGAYKTGKYWLIPLYKGMPQIIPSDLPDARLTTERGLLKTS